MTVQEMEDYDNLKAAFKESWQYLDSWVKFWVIIIQISVVI